MKLFKSVLSRGLFSLVAVGLLIGLLPAPLAGAEPSSDHWIHYRAEAYSDAYHRDVTIHTAEELALLAYESMMGTCSFINVYLGNDISLYGHSWTPIKGESWLHVYGCGYTISGMTVTEMVEFEGSSQEESLFGLFETVGSVSDLTLKNATIRLTVSGPGDAYSMDSIVRCGAIAAEAETVTNCSASVNLTVDSSGSPGTELYIAGLVQDVGIAEDCSVSGSIHVSGHGSAAGIAVTCDEARNLSNRAHITASNITSVGGILIYGYDQVSHCVNYGTITLSADVYDEYYAGGVGCYLYAPAEGCRNEGSILLSPSEGTYCVGGVFGRVLNHVRECGNSGTMTAPASESFYVGGIAGIVDAAGSVSNCQYTGSVSGSWAGGVAAVNQGEISSCRILGSVSGEWAGGVVSINRNLTEACDNYGSVSGKYAGGIAGCNYGEVLACRNFQSLSGEYVGGIAGWNAGALISCVNAGTITADRGESPKAGGIAGYVHVFSSDALLPAISVDHCENTGFVQAVGGIAGGIAGSISCYDHPASVTHCRNIGTVQTSPSEIFGTAAGGIVGDILAENISVCVEQCENTGLITGSGSLGGIVGSAGTPWATEAASIIMCDVYNCGTVLELNSQSDFPSYTGGLAGVFNYPAVLSNALNIGTVSSGNTAGTAVGFCMDGLLLQGIYCQTDASLPTVGSENNWPGYAELVTQLSRGRMGDSANFPEFDFEEIWDMDGTPVLRLSGQTGAPTSDKSYYSSITDRFFRFVATDEGFPQPGGYTLTLNQIPFSTGGSPNIGIPIQPDTESTVLCSKDGYHTYALPAHLVASYNVITMTPSSVTTPFVESLLADLSSDGRKAYRNLRAEGLTVYEATLDLSALTTEHIYVSVNWNGHGPGEVWLQQGDEILPLSDGGFTALQLGLRFDAGSTVYVCGKAEDGTTFRHATKLQIASQRIHPSIDLGGSFNTLVSSNSTDSQMEFMNNQSLELDFTEFSSGLLPVQVKVCSDGTVKGTIGLGLLKAESVRTGTPGESADWDRDTLFDMAKDFVDTCKKGFPISQVANDKLKELRAHSDIRTIPASMGINGDLQVVGYFYGDNSSGTFRFTECNLVLVFNGKIVFTAPYSAFGIPGYIQSEFAAKFETILGEWYFNADSNTIVKNGNTEFNTELSLAATFAVGHDKLLSVGAKGKGTVGIETVIPLDADMTNMYLQGSISLVGNALGFAGEWTVFETDKQYFLYRGDLCWKSGSSLHSLMEQPSFAPAVLNLSAAGPLSENTFQTGIYPAGQTAIATADYLRVLVWQGMREDNANGSQLFYSVGDGFTWSDAAPVDPDGTADFNPVLKTVNGKIYLMWNDLGKAFDALPENYAEVMSSTQISVMRFDPDTRTFTDLGSVGEDNARDILPDLQELNGAPVLSWQCYDTPEAAPQQLTSVLTGSGWTDPVREQPEWYAPNALPEDAPVRGSTAALIGSGNRSCLVYAEGQQLFCLFNDGSGWGSPISLAHLPAGTEAYSVGAAYDNYGRMLISVSCGALTSAQGVLSGQNDLLLYELEIQNDILVSSAGYVSNTLIPGFDRELTAWAEVVNLTGTTLHTLCVDITGEGGYGDARMIPVNIPSGCTETVYFNFSLPEDGADVCDVYTLRFFSEDITEEDLSNNTALCEIRKADLSVEGFYAVSDGRYGSASVWIVNRGLTAVSDAVVQIFGLSADGSALTEEKTITLAPGAAIAVDFEGIDFGGETQVSVVVGGVGDENITANNSEIATVQIFKPGQLSSSILSTSLGGDRATVEFTVENTTNTAQSAIVAVASYVNGQMMDVRLVHIQSLDSQSFHTASVSLYAPADRPVIIKLYLLSADGGMFPLQNCAELSLSQN